MGLPFGSAGTHTFPISILVRSTESLQEKMNDLKGASTVVCGGENFS